VYHRRCLALQRLPPRSGLTRTLGVRTPSQIAKATWAGLFFFLPAVCCIAYWIGVTGFVPMPRLRPAAGFVAPVVAAMYAIAIGPHFFRVSKHSWLSARYKDFIVNAAMIAFAPFAGWCLAQAFISGPLSYASHQLTAGAPVEIQLTVLRSTTTGGRSCRKNALLNDEHFFWRQAVCGISERTVDRLRAGGQLRVFGTASEYGIQVMRYAGDA